MVWYEIPHSPFCTPRAVRGRTFQQIKMKRERKENGQYPVPNPPLAHTKRRKTNELRNWRNIPTLGHSSTCRSYPNNETSNARLENKLDRRPRRASENVINLFISPCGLWLVGWRFSTKVVTWDSMYIRRYWYTREPCSGAVHCHVIYVVICHHYGPKRRNYVQRFLINRMNPALCCLGHLMRVRLQ